MSETPHEHPTVRHYIQIFVLLGILTAVELAIAIAYTKWHPYPKGALVVMLIGLAFYKAALVAMHFMHLKLDPRRLSIAVIAPVCALMVLVTILSFEAIQANHLHAFESAPASSAPAPAAE